MLIFTLFATAHLLILEMIKPWRHPLLTSDNVTDALLTHNKTIVVVGTWLYLSSIELPPSIITYPVEGASCSRVQNIQINGSSFFFLPTHVMIVIYPVLLNNRFVDTTKHLLYLIPPPFHPRLDNSKIQAIIKREHLTEEIIQECQSLP